MLYCPEAMGDSHSIEIASVVCAHEICVICQDELEKDCASVVTHQCGHKFHGQCLVNHLLNDLRCPVCRHQVYKPGRVDDDEAEFWEEHVAERMKKKLSRSTMVAIMKDMDPEEKIRSRTLEDLADLAAHQFINESDDEGDDEEEDEYDPDDTVRILPGSATIIS
jgi:hypothetical protein